MLQFVQFCHWARKGEIVDVVFLIGRLLIAALFVQSGLANHFGRQGVEYARAYNAPAPEILVPASGAAIVLGGVSVAAVALAELGALVIAAFLLGITPIMHAYWKEQEAQARLSQVVNFTKNFGLLGGALILFYAYNQLQGEAGLSITDPLFGRAD
jgi:putative oxidoreductase